MLLFRSLVAALLVVALVSASSAQEKPVKPAKPLDDQLLDDLSGDLLPKPQSKPAAKPKESGLDEKLLDQLEAGEDIGSAPEEDPLTRIGKRMQTVEALIAKHDTSTRTQGLQKQIVGELDKLLEQTKKQCQQCQNASQGSPKSASSSPPKGHSTGEPGNPKPNDSTERLGKPGDGTASPEEVDALVKAVWGHLPEKVRSQMMNSQFDKFLPKYERLIEDFYKRLAEESAR